MPTFGDCDGVHAYHIRKGRYGDVPLDGLNVLGVHNFKGNVWAGAVKIDWGFFFDDRANTRQREALQVIFGGKAGGFPAELAKLTGEVRGVEFVRIRVKVAKDLAHWEAEIPGKVVVRAKALTGPMTPKGKRVQLINAPGSEMGPGTVATWGTAEANTVDAFGFRWDWSGRSSKHIPFNWRGP